MEKELSDDSDSFLRSQATFILGLLGLVKVLKQKLSSQHYRNVSSRSAASSGLHIKTLLHSKESGRKARFTQYCYWNNPLSFYSIKSTLNCWHCFCYRFRFQCPRNSRRMTNQRKESLVKASRGNFISRSRHKDSNSF